MRFTLARLAVATTVALSAALPAQAAEPEAKPQAAEEGFIQLFNGENLEGWKANENSSSWSVEEGAIVCEGPRSHLFYTGPEAPFKDFHFIAEVKTTPGSNAGIYFHTKYQEQGWPKFGFECQVNISGRDGKKSGGLYGIRDVANPPAKDNEWYTQEIIVRGRNIVLKLNGETLVDYTEPENQPAFDERFERRIGKGTFALQAHDPDSKVYFRNLRVKPL